MKQVGILLPLASLPSPYGIGTLGKAAKDFVDFLSDAGQTWWQILPLGPTCYGPSDDSPYQSYSAFAGNPYLISLDALVKELGGYYESRNLNQGGTYRSFHATVRVPADSFSPFLQRAGEVAHVTDCYEQNRNISEVYYERQDGILRTVHC